MNDTFRVSFRVFSAQGVRVKHTRTNESEVFNRRTMTTSDLWNNWPGIQRMTILANNGEVHDIPNDDTNLYNYIRGLDLDYPTQQYGDAIIQVLL